MATYLLDSDIIIDALNRRRRRHALLKRLTRAGHTLACCAVNVAEVFAGARPEDQARTERLLSDLQYYEISRRAAKHGGRLKYDWARKGITLRMPDALVAAVAIDNDLVLVTGNRRHFPMPELEILELPEDSGDRGVR